MASMHSNTYSEGVYLDALGPNDVLLGRGTGPNENRGNVKFRGLLQKKIDTVCCDGNGWENDLCYSRHIAIDVIDMTRSAGGHFVRKLTADEIQSCSEKLGKTYKYVVVADKVARDKAKQSIRFQLELTNKRKAEGRENKQKADIKRKSARAIRKAKKRDRSPVKPRKSAHERKGALNLSSTTKQAAMKINPMGFSRNIDAPFAPATDQFPVGQLLARDAMFDFPPPFRTLPPHGHYFPPTETPICPTTTPPLPPLLAAERAAYAERFLRAHEQLHEERRMRLIMARQGHPAGGGYYPPSSGYLPLPPPMYMMHGTPPPDMLSEVGDDPLCVYTSPTMLPNYLNGDYPLDHNSLYSPSLPTPTPVVSDDPQPVPSAPMSSEWPIMVDD